MAKRIAVVDNTRLKDMQVKRHIQSLCPVNRAGKECIYFEGDRLRIDEALCIGCGICVNAAPNAISIVNLPSELDKDPIHRYGENSFALFNLPVPVKGQSVGILGVNGIGKSTALEIVAGVLKPNLGKPGKEATLQELREYFKGSEIQRHFELLETGDVVPSYKPQSVESIPKRFSGTARELLLRVAGKEEAERLAQEFELSAFFDRDIANISGGELQRLAIAAASAKNANLFIFDEPSSFLDIIQRVKIARKIRSLASDDTSVIAVEHDLIMLDYISDLVHVMYGKEGVFGVVSQPKSARVGINAYFEGYLKEENVRFRDAKLTFLPKQPHLSTESEPLVSWKGVRKSFGDFSLEAEKGEVPKGKVVGVLGENGIGKTTFVKILAGVVRPDKGEIEAAEGLSVSYKPQYLSPSEENVAVVLADALSKHNTLVVRPLGLEPLLAQKLSELSGGELQRVAIAACLGRDASLYLLDEPSAYLDAEQRLRVAKTLRDFAEHKHVSVLVVDHDLLFVDYLAEALLVFQGTPSVRGSVSGPLSMQEGMNLFLSGLGITLRRDMQTRRPRINKEGSRKDREQKESGNLYYA